MAKRSESYLSPADLESAGLTLYGDNWRAGMADHMNCDLSLIWRYMTCRVAVPKPFALALLAMLRLPQDSPLPDAKLLDGDISPIVRPYTKKER